MKQIGFYFRDDTQKKREPEIPVTDVGGAVLFVCSDLAAHVTGADIPVDGGWTIGDVPGTLPG